MAICSLYHAVACCHSRVDLAQQAGSLRFQLRTAGYLSWYNGVSSPNMWEHVIADSVVMNLVSSVMKMAPKHRDNQSAEWSSRLLCALSNQFANQVLISQSSATQRKRINNGRTNGTWVFTGWTTMLWFCCGFGGETTAAPSSSYWLRPFTGSLELRGAEIIPRDAI